MAANNYPGRVAPLPIEEFAAFKEFASAKDKSWPCNGSCLWSFLDAAQIATSILYALGQPGLVAGTKMTMRLDTG